MIENSLDARPQSGLKDAEVVYEAIAEGGITRFLALYQQNSPSTVGPVRSLRPYYLDWLTPYNPSIIHVGGSAKALRQVKKGPYRDLDQFFYPAIYERTTDRLAPHNVYTSFKKIKALNKTKQYKTSKAKAFKRKSLSKAKKPNASKISVHISGASFDSSYSYKRSKNAYVRSQGGEVHKDRENGVITPQVIIVMTVDERTVREETDREAIKTTGKNRVVIFQNGTVKRGFWKRSTIKNQFVFIDTKGKSIPLARGQTWITAIPQGAGSVSWK